MNPLIHKMTNRALYDILRKLGLSELESIAYMEIITCYFKISQPSNSKSIEHTFDHNTVNHLQELGLLYISKDYSGNTVIRIADPRIASRSIYSKYLWSLCPSEGMLRNLSDKQKHGALSFRNSCLQFEQCLGKLFTPSISSDNVLMINNEAISGELATCIRSAKKSIRGITIPIWAPDISLVWETIKDRIVEGISYNRLADEITLISFGHIINKRDIEEIGVGLKILPRHRFQEKYFIIDDEIAFIFWPSGPRNNFPLEASMTRMPMFVFRCCHNFDSLWEEAIPAESLLPHMDKLRNNFIDNCENALGKAIRRAAELLFDYGKFCFASDGTPTYGIAMEEMKELERHLLVVPCPGENKAMIPNISSDVKRLVDNYR